MVHKTCSSKVVDWWLRRLTLKRRAAWRPCSWSKWWGRARAARQRWAGPRGRGRGAACGAAAAPGARTQWRGACRTACTSPARCTMCKHTTINWRRPRSHYTHRALHVHVIVDVGHVGPPVLQAVLALRHHGHLPQWPRAHFRHHRHVEQHRQHVRRRQSMRKFNWFSDWLDETASNHSKVSCECVRIS